MTFNIGYVEGGTNAGCKRPLKPAPTTWKCGCPTATEKPGYLIRCVDCKTDRDARR